MSVQLYLERNRERHLAELVDLLRIPSVSTDPDRSGDVGRCATTLALRLREAGLSAEVMATAGHPVVYAEWMGAPGAPTVLVYGHYDVQPPDPLGEWRHPPFEPTIEGGNLVARGATDDKGQMYCHVKGVEAHLATTGRLPTNVKFLIEGEEEIGSPSLAGFLRQNATKLRADALVISDSHMAGPRRPSITIGLRGIVYVEVAVRGPAYDLHSGRYGGGVTNPAIALARMIARLHDGDGKVAIPGFYDRVRDITNEERREFATLGHDDRAYLEELGVPAAPGERGYSILERITARPCLDVNGIWGGYTGTGSKTVIPSVARMKVSCRLVPDQDPAEIERMLRAYIQEIAPREVSIEFTPHHGGPPYLADRNSPAMEAARAALRRAWEVEPVHTRTGGSIPIVGAFKEILGLDSILVGLGQDDDRLHSPNEKFGLENFYTGIKVSAYLFEELGRTPRR